MQRPLGSATWVALTGHDLPKATSSQDVWYYLVLFGGCVFFLDVFFRRVTVDLSWAPDSRSALLVTQRPLAGYSPGTSLFRLRQVPLEGPPRDLADLAIAPIEGSWVWAPDGHAVA